LWLLGHVPGTIAALIILHNTKNERKQYAVA
jgi:hypothetical protein